MDQANVLIIGGGVIGCAIANEVAQKFQDVFVVEQNPRPGMATSTRNSGVIHSGLYYKPGSLKARNCVLGREEMYRFCQEHGIACQRCVNHILDRDRGGGPVGVGRTWIGAVDIDVAHRRAS